MDLQLTDLYNPNGITSISTKYGMIELAENQEFQEYPGSIELWQKLPDGRLIKIDRWIKGKTVHHAEYKDRPGVYEGVFRPYIKPEKEAQQ